MVLYDGVGGCKGLLERWSLVLIFVCVLLAGGSDGVMVIFSVCI